MSEIVRIPFRGDEILAVEIDGKPHILLRPALEAIGLDFSAQWRKIRGRSWTSVVPLTTQVPGDSQRREVITVPLRTFLMLLATINEAHVADGVRPALIAYQTEVADVIEAHFTRARGGPDERVPFTWTIDEACAIIRQRYQLDHNVVSLCRLFRTAGIWKQNGTPTAKYAYCFHFTGTAWTVVPVGMAAIGKQLLKVTHQLQQSYAMQMRLELEGFGRNSQMEQLSTDDMTGPPKAA
jgi:hypothetical protein